MDTILFLGILLLCFLLMTILSLCNAEEEIKDSDLKDKIIEAYGDKWYIAAQLCDSKGWIPYYDYWESFPQDYNVKTINEIIHYRPKLNN